MEDRDTILKHLAERKLHGCERTFANVYLWARFYNEGWAEIEEEKQAITPIVTEDDLPQNIEEDDEAGEMIVEEIGDKQPEEVKLSQKEQIPSGSKNTIRDLERSLAVQVTETAVKSGYLTREARQSRRCRPT